jgi:O-antigen ligase
VTPAISQRGPRAALAAIALVGATAVFVLVGGTGIGTAAAALVLLTLGVYAAFRWPLEALFGLFVLLVPFDNVLNTGSFGTLTKLLGVVAGACLLFWVVRRRRVTLASESVRILGLLLVWMLASCLWAVDQKAALQIMPTYAGLMLLYAVLTMVPVSTSQFRMLLALVVAGGLCAAAYGAHLFYHDPSFAQQALTMRRLVIQVGDYHIDPNHFSDALLFPVAILAMWALRARQLIARLACVGGLALMVVAILLSGSREGLTALLVIAAYYLWRSRYRLRLAIGIIGVLLVAATVQTSVFARFATALETGGSGRTSIWAVAIEAAKHRFLQGYGIGNFTDAFNLFYLGVHQPYPYGWDSPAHNLILHYLVELGIVGIALIAWFFVAQFRSLRNIGRDDDLYDYRIVMEAVLLAVLVVSMTIDLFQYKYAWVVFAMVALLRNLAKGQQSAAMRPARSAMMSVRSARPRTRSLPWSPSARSAVLSSRES